MTARLRCPEGDLALDIRPGDPLDDSLDTFWRHVCTHTGDPLERLRLWTAAQEPQEPA